MIWLMSERQKRNAGAESPVDPFPTSIQQQILREDDMKLKLAAVMVAIMLGTAPVTTSAFGQGCDTIPGREGGPDLCGAGQVCTGPFEGMYGRGNCQSRSTASGQGCDTIAGRDGGQEMCPASQTCTGPFEGMYGRGNCQ